MLCHYMPFFNFALKNARIPAYLVKFKSNKCNENCKGWETRRVNSFEIYIILRRSESQGTHGIHQEPDIPPGARVLRQQLPDEAQEVRDRRGTRPHGETGN